MKIRMKIKRSDYDRITRATDVNRSTAPAEMTVEEFRGVIREVQSMPARRRWRYFGESYRSGPTRLVITTECESTCSAYGDYNPHTYARVVRNASTESEFTTITVAEYHIGHGTNVPLRRSDNAAIYSDTSPYRDCTLTTWGIEHAGRRYPHECEISHKGTSYHYRRASMTHADARKAVIAKRAKKLDMSRKAKLRRAERGPTICAATLVRDYGWCEEGVADVCDYLGLGRRERLSDVMAAWKAAGFAAKQYIHDTYPSEMAQVLRIARAG